MTRTTYFGWSQGANEANTEVAFLPNSWAVPVLPATQTWLNGKPPNAPAAVPWVTTPASAERMEARVSDDARRLRTPGGALFSPPFARGSTSTPEPRGPYRAPPLASAT